ncbi:MAG TPA: hypothetical protein VLM89_08020, partial [Phycisphaerae bacterium]|nr:hypothetical protein [Phycisphaerae bacterium]
MKTICLVGLVGACCLAAGLVSAVGGDDRELRELARRVDKLERSRDEMNRTIDRLAKSVADLEKSLGS